MNSSWNGHYQPPPPPSSQAFSQHSQHTTWNQARTANGSHWNNTNQVAQQSSCAYYSGQVGGYATSNFQHQGNGQQQYYQQNSYMNIQNQHGTTSQQSFRTHSGFSDSVTGSSPNTNAAHPQQNVSKNWNQRSTAYEEQNLRTRLVKMSDQWVVQNKLTKAFDTTATSHPHKTVFYGKTDLVSATSHNRHEPPPYPVAASHLGNNGVTTDSPRENMLHNLSHKMAQYLVNPYSTKKSQEVNHQVASKPNEVSQRSAAHSHQETLRRETIAKIAEDLRQSFTRRPDQNMQPGMPPVMGHYNSNAFQPLPPNSAQPLPESSHIVTQRTQQGAIVPQQNSAPNALRETATGGGRGGRRKTHTISYFKRLLEAKEPEMQEILQSVSSSVHTSKRAVAVVQPLSQESSPVCGEKTISDLMVQLADKHEESSSKNSAHLTTESANHQERSQKCATDTGYEPEMMQVNQHVTPVTPDLLSTQCGEENKSEKEADAQIFDLSSVPTTTWTLETLINRIQKLRDEEAKRFASSDSSTVPSANVVQDVFWGGDITSLTCMLKTGWYKDLITCVTDFCNNVTTDSVILSQIDHSVRMQLQRYHKLKDDEVYAEQPYRSSWRNVNEQLDDIDEAFGFPPSLTLHSHTTESHSQSGQDWTVDCIRTEIVSEVLSQSKSQPADSSEETQAAIDEVTETQTTSLDETEGDSNDHCCSFKIQVMPPEEAKVIFEQIVNAMPQSLDTDKNHVMNSSLQTELPEVVPTNIEKRTIESVSPVETVCCIIKWMEILGGSNTNVVSKCRCNKVPDLKDISQNTFDHKEMAEQEEDLRVIMSGNMFIEGYNQVTSGRDICLILDESEFSSEPNHSVLTEDDQKHLSDSDEQPNNVSQINRNSQSNVTFLNEKEDDVSISATESKVQSTGSAKEMKSLPCSEGEVEMMDFEENCGEPWLLTVDESPQKPEEQTPLSPTSVGLHCKHETVERKQKRPRVDVDVHSPPSPPSLALLPLPPSPPSPPSLPSPPSSPLLSSSPLLPSPPSTPSSPSLLATPSLASPPSTPSSPSLLSMPSLASPPSAYRKVSFDATDDESLVSSGRSVQLAVFGSVSRNKHGLIVSRKTHASYSRIGYEDIPEVISVKLSPLKRKTQTAPEQSVKERLYEKWRSCLPISSSHRSNLKTRTKKDLLTNTAKLSVSNEKKLRKRNRDDKYCVKPKKKKRRYRKRRSKTDTVTQPFVQDKSGAVGGSRAVIPLQENNVLRFSVLPKTFNLLDGSNETLDGNDSVSDKPAHVGGRDSNQSATRGPGTWGLNPEKNCALPKSSVKNSHLFMAFQKKYKETHNAGQMGEL